MDRSSFRACSPQQRCPDEKRGTDGVDVSCVGGRRRSVSPGHSMLAESPTTPWAADAGPRAHLTHRRGSVGGSPGSQRLEVGPRLGTAPCRPLTCSSVVPPWCCAASAEELRKTQNHHKKFVTSPRQDNGQREVLRRGRAMGSCSPQARALVGNTDESVRDVLLSSCRSVPPRDFTVQHGVHNKPGDDQHTDLLGATLHHCQSAKTYSRELPVQATEPFQTLTRMPGNMRQADRTSPRMSMQDLKQLVVESDMDGTFSGECPSHKPRQRARVPRDDVRHRRLPGDVLSEIRNSIHFNGGASVPCKQRFNKQFPQHTPTQTPTPATTACMSRRSSCTSLFSTD